MSVLKRGGVWWYDLQIAGRRYRGSTKKHTKTAAQAVEARVRAKIVETGELPILRKAPTLRDFSTSFTEYLAESRLKQKSRDYYTNGIRLLLETELADKRVSDIRRDDAEKVRFQVCHSRKERESFVPASEATTNNALRTLRVMLGKAADWGIIQGAPRVHLVHEVGRDQVFTPEQEQRLLAVATSSLRDVLVIMLDTGMRPDEVYRMRWEDVNWQQRRIHVQSGKTKNARRYVPLSDRVKDALVARMQKKDKTTGKLTNPEWVFTSDSESGHIESVQKAFETARRKALLPEGYVLYTARHTFGTYLYKATRNLALVMQVMGHSDVKTAMRYQHPELELALDAIEQRVAMLPAQTEEMITTRVQ